MEGTSRAQPRSWVIAPRRMRGETARALGERVRLRAQAAACLGACALDDAGRDARGSSALRPIVWRGDRRELDRRLGSAAEDLWIEAAIVHSPQRAIPVTVQSGPLPLRGARVIAMVQTRTERLETLDAVTDELGAAALAIPSDARSVSFVACFPVTGHWSMIHPEPDGAVEFDCPRLPAADRNLMWWHAAVGIREFDAGAGAGIRVGVVDTELGRNPALRHVTRTRPAPEPGDAIGPAEIADRGIHGTHVAGIVAARPLDADVPGGIAPGADVAFAAVGDGRHCTQADLAGAIDELSDTGRCDIVNLSWGATARSQILLDAVADAADRGTTCVAAAGNVPDRVLWPAADPGVVAVAALGSPARYPVRSLAARACAATPGHDAGGGLFLSRSSGRGPQIDCCAPGVGIVSTIPVVPLAGGRPWAAMDGTSMAAPVVTGVLAVRLSRDEAYRTLPRGIERTRRARESLAAACVPTHLGACHQGLGLPRVDGPPPAVRTAVPSVGR